MAPGPAADELTRVLKAKLVEEGFAGVGVAAAGRLDRDAAVLGAWLRRDMHATMSWMSSTQEKRTDPRELLPGCRSVVVATMSYWPGGAAAIPRRQRGRVALYARGRDYHKVLGRRLRKVSEWLELETGAPTRSFVDTAPVLERAWAERGGVGWIGKNSMLLSRESGSWLLLGEILTAAKLAPDPGPHADHCGSCTACRDACPTGAIVADGVVDSNRCIAYWTIEHRGVIPVERRPGIGDWIFGCDVCQDVCPWNRGFERTPVADPFGFRDDLDGLDAAEIAGMDEATFRERYSGTSLMRAKWEGMRRNACIVLGNRGSAEALPALEQVLGDADPVLRRHAAWAVRRIGGAAAEALLAAALAAESDPEVRGELGDHGFQAPEVVP